MIDRRADVDGVVADAGAGGFVMIKEVEGVHSIRNRSKSVRWRSEPSKRTVQLTPL
jgi:hypothetical protein